MQDDIEAAVNPSHYLSHPSGVECITIARDMNCCLAQALQYVWRCGLKDDPRQELRKAAWFLNEEQERRETLALQFAPHVPAGVPCAMRRVINHTPDRNQAEALSAIWTAHLFPNDSAALEYAIRAVNVLRSIAENDPDFD